MSMPLDFVQLEFWTYGFSAAIFTATAGWAFGLTALWWFLLVQLAVHREDPEEIRADFHTWWLVSMCSGLLVGFFLLWSLRMDRLIDTEFLNYRNAKRYLSMEFFWIVVWATLTTAGYYYTNGDFSNGFGTVPLTTAQTVGITMLVVGIVGIIATFIWMFANNTDRRESTQNAKYIIAVALMLVAAPAAYDYPHNSGLGPWHGLIALAVIIVYWALMILWIGFTYSHPLSGSLRCGRWLRKTDKEGRLHPVDRFYDGNQAIAFLIAGFLCQFVLYLVAWLVDTHPWTSPEPTDVEPVVTAIAITSVVEALILVIIYYAGNTEKWWPNATRRESPASYDTHVAEKIL